MIKSISNFLPPQNTIRTGDITVNGIMGMLKKLHRRKLPGRSFTARI